MAAIQGYGRLCWHFCSVHEWLQPQLQQPWGLARKSALDLDAAVRTTSQKLIQARAAANGLIYIHIMMYILEPLELENYSTNS